MMSMLGAIFEDFYMCVSLIYKLQDNYSIFGELHPNYQFQVTRKQPKAQY